MGMIAATASALWLSAFGVYGYPVYPCLLMTMLSIYFVLPAYCREGGRAPLLLAGGFIGVAALFRPDVGAIAAISHMTALTLFQVKARLDGVERSPKLIPAVAIFSAGVLLVAVPLWLSVLVIASPTEVLRDLVIIPMETYGRMRSLPFKWNSVNDWGVSPASCWPDGNRNRSEFWGPRVYERKSSDGNDAMHTLRRTFARCLLRAVLYIEGRVAHFFETSGYSPRPSFSADCLSRLAFGSGQPSWADTGSAVGGSYGCGFNGRCYYRDYTALMTNKDWI